MERKIDLFKAMRTFLTVVECNSFSVASRQLNIVTSAVSRQVSDLEKHFNCQLLYRTTRAMNLTAEGQYYLDEFKAVIAKLDALEAGAYERQQRIAGHLRLTAPANSGRLGVQKQISEFLNQHPDVTLSWLLVNRYVNLVEEGVDIAVRVGELADSSLVARKIDRMEILFVASPALIQQHGLPSDPKDFMTLPCIADSSNRQPGKWKYLDNRKEHQISINTVLEVNQGDLVAEFATLGHGFAQLPRFIVQPYLDSGQLVTVLNDFCLEALPVSLVYPANRLANPVIKAFTQHVINSSPISRSSRD
ncbi:LysR substrate-binding domain-containing protein [Photobacterium minamisatsumaniensis]|uniref:LysR family transcriptional regulator n=1 Tax=Photobacterium minamisatsumaniensis TaxID=2910233 RepID=UPI003D0DD587